MIYLDPITSYLLLGFLAYGAVLAILAGPEPEPAR